MDVLRGYRGVPERAKGAVLAIGNFDGVHRGHQAVFDAAWRAAEVTRGEEGRRPDRELRGQGEEGPRIGVWGELRPEPRSGGQGTVAADTPLGVMVFEPHPRAHFVPDQQLFRLTSLAYKLHLFEAFGLDLAVVLDFDAALAGFSARRFAEDVLVAGLEVRHVVIGADFFFGKGRDGDPAVMRALGEELGFALTVVEPVADLDGVVFSSSRVRALLGQGDVRAAAHVLGHWWRVIGRVTGGAGRGLGLGYPTVNMPLPPGQTLGHGIYAARVHARGAVYPAAAYLGTRPTFDNGPPVLEAFLLDFAGDLYGTEIVVEFIDFVRGDESFESAGALKAQMAKDCARAEDILAAVAADDPMLAYPLGRALAGEG